MSEAESLDHARWAADHAHKLHDAVVARTAPLATLSAALIAMLVIGWRFNENDVVAIAQGFLIAVGGVAWVLGLIDAYLVLSIPARLDTTDLIVSVSTTKDSATAALNAYTTALLAEVHEQRRDHRKIIVKAGIGCLLVAMAWGFGYI